MVDLFSDLVPQAVEAQPTSTPTTTTSGDLFSDLVPSASPAPTASPASPQPNAPSGDAVNQLQQLAFEKRNESLPAYQRYGEGLARGFSQANVGMNQLLSHIPVVGEKLYGTPEENNAEAQLLQMAGKGSGIAGSLGEITGNPTNVQMMGAAPEGFLGRAAVGAAQGLVQPSTDTTNAMANVGTDVLANTLIPAAAKPLTSGIGHAAQWAANKSGLSDLAGTIAEKLGKNPTMSDVYKASDQTGLDRSGKSPKEIYDNMAGWLGFNTKGVANNISKDTFNPVAANTSISSKYDDALKQSSQLYDKVKELGAGKYTDANDLLNNVDSLVNELDNKKTISPQEERGLNELKYWQKKINSASQPELKAQGNVVPLLKNAPNKIAYNDVVDLKQALNQNFNPSKFSSRADAPFAKLASNVNDTLDTIAKATDQTEKNPENDFSTALKAANDHWTDVSKTWRDNDLLSKFWKPDDYYEAKALSDRGVPLSGELRERSNSWLDKIDSPEKFEALQNALPDKQAAALRAAKFTQMRKEDGFDANSLADPRRFAIMKKAVQNDPKSIENLNNMRTVLADLNLRGLDNSMPDNVAREALEGSKSAQEAFKAVYSASVGKRRYALSHAAQALVGKEGATGEALKGFQKGIQAGAPFKKSIATGAKNIAPFVGSAGALTAEDAIEQ